jgi:hypothetical protein
MTRKKPAPPDPITTLGAIERLAEIPDMIQRLDAAVRKLSESGLNRRCLIVLLADVSGVNKTNVGKVLDALPKLVDSFVAEPGS